MKARTKKTRWLLLTLFFGLLAAAGFTLTRHRGVRFVSTASPVMPVKHTVQQTHTALFASSGKQTAAAPAATPLAHELADGTYPDDLQSRVTGRSNSSSNVATTGDAPPATLPVGASSDGTQQSNAPASASSHPTPQNGAGWYAYNGYAPLGCELPAGCGVSSRTGYVSHQPSLTGGTVPLAHNSQGANPPNDGSPTNDDNTPPQTGPGPGSNLSVAAAPELDPTTLGGAVTLLLGSLAVLRGRRARATR
jgi:hypothetical protein